MNLANFRPRLWEPSNLIGSGAGLALGGCVFWTLALNVTSARAAGFGISSFDHSGSLSWTNAFASGVCCLETADSPLGPWSPAANVFTANANGQVMAELPRNNRFFRLLAANVSASSPGGFTNLTQSYGLLRTVASNGAGGVDGIDYWQSSYEGNFATNVALSRPHFAMADAAGNMFIVDKDSHSVLKVTADGRIHTVAGTHQAGNGPDAATPATTVALNFPNGLWVGGDSMVYVLDTGNGKVRWLSTNGLLTTLLTDSNGISGGRGLWVSDDRTLAYYVNGNDVKRWSPGTKIKSANNDNFSDPGNLIVRPDGNLLVTDRGANVVYLVYTAGANAGNRVAVFGDGSTNPAVDGAAVTATGLYGVRGIWPVPTGGYLLALHEGSQVLYVDAAGIVHVFVDGSPTAHAGDGAWFYAPGQKVSEVRSVSMDSRGHILIVENDNGYIRQIDFLRLTP